MMDRSKKILADFYQNADGKMPVRDWLLRQSREDKRIIGKDIQKVEFGWPIGMPYCRSLGHSLWEVRSNISEGRITRIIFFIHRNRMVLLHGFIKKTQKTPDKDLALAVTRMKEVKSDDKN